MYVESKAYFKMPKSYILGQIREPGCLNKFHPFCKKNIAHKWPGNGSIDELEYLNGRKYKRCFFNWTDNGYDLKIGGKKEMAIVNWYVVGSDEECSLRVRINPNIENYVPFKNILIQNIFWFLYIRPKLQSYINHVVNGFSFYVSNNKDINKNQFGKHSWFSLY